MNRGDGELHASAGDPYRRMMLNLRRRRPRGMPLRPTPLSTGFKPYVGATSFSPEIFAYL